MRKNRILSVCAIILAVLMLFGGCATVLQNLENAQLRENTETMLDALLANDFQTAYSLVRDFCPEEDFKTKFPQMQELLGDVDGYELKLLSIYTNYTVSNGEKSNVVTSVYEMTSESGKMIINVRTVGQNSLATFYLTPYEKSDYYSTGTLNNMKNATATQWIFLLLNILAIGLTVFALVDCCKQKIQKKALWIVLLLLGFFTVGITSYATGFKFNFNLGWITAYSALIRYGSGTVVLRLMLPVGTVIYFIKRRSLLSANTPAIATAECEPACSAEESCAEQQPTQTPQNDGM